MAKRKKSKGRKGKFTRKVDSKVVIGIVVLLVIVVGYLYFSNVDRPDRGGESTSVEVVSHVETKIEVHDQSIVNFNIIIDSYSMKNPGFISVHFSSAGERGPIIGQSELLNGKGSFLPIKINGNFKDVDVIVVAYYDNGDSLFRDSEDEVVVSSMKRIRLG